MIYRVNEPLLAVTDGQSRPFTFVTITVGSTITIKGDVQQSGLAGVLYNGMIVAAFMRDIEARAEQVEANVA